MKLDHLAQAHVERREDWKSNLTMAHLPQPADPAEILPLPCRMCSGSIQQWRLRPGLDLVIHDVGF
jgi:hypothetical protein